MDIQENRSMFDQHYALKITVLEGALFAARGRFQPGDMTNYQFMAVADEQPGLYHVWGNLIEGKVLISESDARIATTRETENSPGAAIHEYYVKTMAKHFHCNPWTARALMLWLVEILDKAAVSRGDSDGNRNR